MWSPTRGTYRLKAFTVQELLVGMVVSSLIMGMMYTIYAQIDKQLFAYNDNQEELKAFNQFRQLLSQDIRLAHQIERKDDKRFELLFLDRNHSYLLKTDRVIRDRNNGVRDTFHITATRIELKEETGKFNDHQALELTVELLGEEIVLYESKGLSTAKKINSLYFDEY